MSELKVKQMFIGITISIKGLGQIKIKQEHAPIFARRKMYAYLEETAPVKKLVAKKSHSKKKADAPAESE